MKITTFPYVISSNYSAIAAEENPSDRFRQVLRTFAATLKFVSLVALAEYLRRPEHSNREVDAFLADPCKLRRPSLGHFKDLLRIILDHGGEWLEKSTLSGMAGIWRHGKSRSRLIERQIGPLIHLRNLYVHSDVIPSPDEASDLAERSLTTLNDLLETLDWMKSGRLLIVSHEGKCFVARQEVIPIEEAGLPVEYGVWWECNGLRTALPPFLIEKLQDADPKSIDSVLQYETLAGHQIKYLFGKHAHFIDQRDVIPPLTAVIGAAETRLASLSNRHGISDRESGGADIDWHTLVAQAASRSERTTADQASLGKYLRATYAERPGIENSLRQFLGSDKRLLILVGEAGFGKTNLLCHLAQELMRENHAVLLYSGRLFQGESISERIAQDLGWSNGDLLSLLARLGDLDVISAGRRIIILFDALNEHPSSQGLFDGIYRLLANPRCPGLVKAVVSSRPLAWESIEAGFAPDRRVIFSPQEAPERERGRLYLPLGPFSDEELEEAFTRWRAFTGFVQPVDMDADLRALLHQPILFRFFVDMLDRRTRFTPSAAAPVSAEGLLLERFQQIEDVDRRRVHSVVSAMWRRGKDWLSSSEYVFDPDLEPWINSDQDEFSLAIYACPDEIHRHIQGKLMEFDERQLTRIGACPVCGKDLIKIREKRVKRPLDQLREEGILCLGLLPDNEEILRFTYDRLYETLTGDFVFSSLLNHQNRAETLAGLIEKNAEPDKATLTMALQSGLLQRLQINSEEGLAILLGLSGQKASGPIVHFLNSVWVRWAERDLHAAWQGSRAMLDQATALYRSSKTLCAGLQAGIEASTMILVLGEGLDPHEIRAGHQRLVAMAFDSDLSTALPLSQSLGDEGGSLEGQAVSDFSLNRLLDYCLDQCSRGTYGTANALEIIGLMTGRIQGLVRLWGQRSRLHALSNWLIRLITLQVRNEAFNREILVLLRSLLGSFPLVKPNQAWTQRILRSILLHLASKPALRIADARIAALVTAIPPSLRRFPNDPPPTMTKMLHLTGELAPAYARLIHLMEHLEEELTAEDVDTLKAFERLCFDEPFRGVLAACEGTTLSMRSMHCFETFLPIAEQFVIRLAENEEFPGNDMVWGLLHRREALPDDLYDRVFQLIWKAISRTRKNMIQRYEMSGQFAVWLCPIQVPDLYRDDGDMPGCRRFADEAAQRKDWTLLARFWDQLLFAGLQVPKPVLHYVGATIAFCQDAIEVLVAGNLIAIPIGILAEESADMAERRCAGYDLDAEARPEAVALLHLLGTVATMELAFPREVTGFYRRLNVSANVISLIRRLASVDTLRKLRDEKMMSYFFNYCALEFPRLRQYLVDMWKLVIADAKARDYAEPWRKDLVRLLSRLIDRGLALIYEEIKT